MKSNVLACRQLRSQAISLLMSLVSAAGLCANTWYVDDDNYLWLICEGTGQVWRGRVNKLGWEE